MQLFMDLEEDILIFIEISSSTVMVAGVINVMILMVETMEVIVVAEHHHDLHINLIFKPEIIFSLGIIIFHREILDRAIPELGIQVLEIWDQENQIVQNHDLIMIRMILDHVEVEEIDNQ